MMNSSDPSSEPAATPHKDRLTRLINRSQSGWAITLASTAEALFVPVPIEAAITPMMIAKPERVWIIAAWTLLGSIIGTSMLYFIGLWFFDTFGEWIIAQMGWQDQFADLQARFRSRGIATVAFVSLSPIPFALAALGAGAAKMNFGLFLLVAGATRAVRYIGLAVLVLLFGDRVKSWLDYIVHNRMARRISLGVTLVVTALLIWWAA